MAVTPSSIQPEEIRLSNGIPVILQPFDGPVAATYWWVRTGSADEAPDEAGFAHFLEHMLFKDAAAKETGKASTGQMARAIESLGGDINAYTSFDQTVYHVTCAAHQWERVIDVFGAMAKPQKFLKTDFEREREVILEEMRKNEDSPGRQLFQSLFGLTFRKHPYGRPVIGFDRTLKAAKVQKLENFYRKNYVAGKMGLILVGPIQDRTGARRKAIIRALEKHFGQKVLRAGKVPRPHPRPAETPLRDGGLPPFKVRAFDVKTPTLSVSFRVPELSDPDVPALDLLAGVLGMGELSRVYQRLFYQTSLATEASGGMYIPRDPGMLYFQAETESLPKLNEAATELFKELRRIQDEGPTPEELSRVLVNAESERLYATQTADGMAGRLGFLKYIVGDLDFDRKYIDRLREVDAARVQEVAQKYLEPRRMSGVVLVPKDQKDFDASPIAEAGWKILGRAEARPASRVSKPAARKAPGGVMPVEFIKLPSGIQVAYLERPQSHVFSVHGSVLGGLRLELTQPIDSIDRDWGSSYLMSLSWTKGTRGRNAREIAALVEGSAASLEGFSGRNSIGLQMTALGRDWGKLSALYNEVLLGPAFPKDEVDHSRRIAEDSVRGIEDHTSQLCSKLFLETLFEKHPYGRLTTGSMESLAAIDSAKLAGFHRRWMRPERLALSVSGAIRRPALDAWLRQLDDAAKALASEGGKTAENPEIPSEEPLKAPRWAERSLGREQVHIIVGGLGTRIFAEDRHALRLLQTLLGGQSGRLFIELREKKSLAYTVSPISFEGLERGYAGTYIACAPNKKDEAIAGMREVLERLAEKGPTAAEMERAKEFYLGRRAMDLQGDASISAHFGLELLYGIPHLAEEEIIRKVRAIRPKEIQDVCRKYLVEPFMVTSVVG